MKYLKWILFPFGIFLLGILLLTVIPKTFYQVWRDHRKAVRLGKTFNPHWFKEIPYKLENDNSEGR